MTFELLDRYLLDGAPSKAEVVDMLLNDRSTAPGTAAFYTGMQMLGARTPDLTLIALRLVLAGKKADDESVVRLRTLVERSRAKGADASGAADEYRRELS